MAMTVTELRPVGNKVPAHADAGFEEFYRAYARRLRGLVRRRIHDHELAAEVVQDTFLRAHAYFGRLDPSRSAWPWLAAVASNLCADALRRKPVAGVSLDDVEAADQGADPAEAFERALRADAIIGVLAGLPARQRQVLMLKDGEGWTAEQIARLDGVSTDGVKSLVRRARCAFRESYERVAAERGLNGVVGLFLAPLAHLRARAERALATAAGRLPVVGGPIFGVPLDMPSLVGAVVMSGLLLTGTAAAEVAPPSDVDPVAVSVQGPEPAGSDGAAAGAPPPDVRRTAVGVTTPEGAPLATATTAAVTEEGEERTLNAIIAAKVGDTAYDSETQARFNCDYSEVRTALCDAAEAAPALDGDG